MPGDAAIAPHRPTSPVIAWVFAAVFAVAVLTGMERWTISSTVPPPEVWERAGTDEDARLATLRSIGTDHAFTLRAAGVNTVCDLAAADPAALWSRMHAIRSGYDARPTPPEVRAWIRAARRDCEARH